VCHFLAVIRIAAFYIPRLTAAEIILSTVGQLEVCFEAELSKILAEGRNVGNIVFHPGGFQIFSMER
jgi:hypothetical protein